MDERELIADEAGERSLTKIGYTICRVRSVWRIEQVELKITFGGGG
jgi:hypothetical protein